jgi:hypothetical protein
MMGGTRNGERGMQNQSGRVTRLLRLSFCILTSAFCICSNGCIAGAVLGKLPQYTAAKYVPDKDKPMLVWAENYRDPSGGAVMDADELARLVFDDLEQHKVAPMVSPERAMELRSRDREQFRQMPITLMGQDVGARRVLYISVTNTATDSNGGTRDMLRASATALVRVVDVQSGATVWPPAASDGYPVSATTPVTHLGDGIDEGSVRESLQQQLGVQIARLFYKHDPMAEE